MAKISKELLRTEINNWKTVKRLLHRQVVNFGSYMNKKYGMRSTSLNDIEGNKAAIREILNNHVQEIQVRDSN